MRCAKAWLSRRARAMVSPGVSVLFNCPRNRPMDDLYRSNQELLAISKYGDSRAKDSSFLTALSPPCKPINPKLWATEPKKNCCSESVLAESVVSGGIKR